MNLKTEVAGIGLDHPIFNASGPLCTTDHDLNDLLESESSAITTKSCTIERRDGNSGQRYFDFGKVNSINSMGLPNMGYKYYLEELSKPKYASKPVFVSMAGLSPEDNFIMGPEFAKLDNVDALEFNLSCPNVPGKPQLCYDPDEVQDFVNQMDHLYMEPIRWGVKLAPYFDPVHINEIADILNGSSIDFITCINSPGNGLVIDPIKEIPVIEPKGGLGGIGGPIIKPFGLSNVYQFRKALVDEISIIGVGGIQWAPDIYEYLLVGADAVQIGTAFQTNGTSLFKTLKNNLSNLISEIGYESISDFKGNIKL